jgi:hypothetical protein
MMKLDANGEHVVRFASEAKNLSRLALLHELIFEIYRSDDWRDYTTALGRQRWREAEFDYFLIANDVARDDAYGVFAWNREGTKVAAALMSDDPKKRRPLDEAAKKYLAPGAEDLRAAAKRLGWVRRDGEGEVLPPLSRHSQEIARDGDAPKKHRPKHRPATAAERRSLMDGVIVKLAKRFHDARELRYLIEQLRRLAADVKRADKRKRGG